MISLILGVAVWILQILSFVILIYCVMTLVAPRNALVQKAGGYIEPVLAPFRGLMYRVFPKLRGYALDFSPILAWLVIDLLIWALNLIRGIFR